MIGIVTIIDNNNYGNRLQNYALYKVIEKFGEVKTLNNEPFSNSKIFFILRCIKNFRYKGSYSLNKKRKENFYEFNKYITFDEKKLTAYSNDKNYDYFIVGSDQVWNCHFGRLRDVDLLSFANSNKRISYAASFGTNEIPQKNKFKVKKELNKFKAISVREDRGREIVEKITKRKDVKVLIDPTMLLTSEEWDKVSKKPKILKSDRFILNYFLGELSEVRKKEINRIAKENNCEVINILDKNSPFYECGPSEFLWLEKNAFLICTDSFHSSVFAILYNTPFLVFDREDNNISMNSRLETLLKKFNLQDRKYQDKISNKHLYFDNKEASKILEKEREKSINWLKDALDLEK